MYNAWHKTELEKWLDDHDIPYPAAADRKDLADSVAKNWDKASTAAYETWDDNRLRTWLEKRAIEFDPISMYLEELCRESPNKQIHLVVAIPLHV